MRGLRVCLGLGSENEELFAAVASRAFCDRWFCTSPFHTVNDSDITPQ